MERVHDIADWFLCKDSMTPKKLQKLCYYAQAWYCTLYDDGPLFDEEIQAWVHGPVVSSLYPTYAHYRWNEIPKKEKLVFDMTDKVLSLLESVYDTYGDFSGDQLEQLTHSEAPWIEARGSLKPWDTCTEPITHESMKNFYGKVYEESQND